MAESDFPSLFAPSAAGAPQGHAAPANGTSTTASIVGSGSGAAGGPSSSTSAAAALEQIHGQADAGQEDQDGENGADAVASSSSAPGGSSGKKGGSNKASNLDLGDEDLFPSLGAPSAPPGKGKAVAGGWGGAARSRAAAAAAAAPAPAVPSFTETLTLPSASINVNPTPQTQRSGFSNAPADPTTLGGVINLLVAKYNGVRIDSSSSTAKGTTTFLLRAQRQQDIDRVKRDLMSRIVKKVTETLQVPASTKPFIIGAKGRTLKTITEETGVNIQIPRDGVQGGPAPFDGPATGEDGGEDGETEDPLIPITLYGNHPSVQAAKQRILAIVNERTSRLSTKVSTISHELYHLLSAKLSRGELVSEEDAGSVDIRIPPVWKFRAGGGRGASANDAGASPDGAEGGDGAETSQRDNSITLTGDREAVTRAVEALAAAADELTRTTQTLVMTLSKRQHRFILPPVSDQILHDTGCAIEVPPASNPTDQITIRGPSAKLVEALQLVMAKANAAAVDTVDLATIHGINTPAGYTKQVARYLLAKAKLRKVADEEGVQIFIPRSIDSHSTIDIVATQGPKGPQEAMGAARKKVLEVLKPLAPSVFASVEVDPLVHRFLIGRKGNRISSFEEKNSVQVVFPPQSTPSDSEDAKNILLVFVGQDHSSSARVLGEVKDEILKLAKEAADITSQTLRVPSKLHRFIIGPSGTTLNALIGTGEERLVNVRFGSSPAGSGAEKKAKGSASDEDEIVIRGPSEEVKKLAKEIERIAEEAKNDEIVNGYTAEFDIEHRFVAHIVGKGGAGVTKLKEDLGVRIDFGDSAPGSATDGMTVKSKKPAGKTSSKSTVRIVGRKENVEEAKKRVLRQTEQLADETTLSVPLLTGLERGALIGKQGTYVQRLETKYDVRINFPRSNAAEEGERDDVITIRGGKKGADGAKKELVELMEYEKENNQSTTLSVPARALPKIFGRGGVAIRELQDETGTEIDVSKNDASNPSANGTMTIKGTKAAIANAKKQIQAIVAEIQDEATLEMQIPRQFHVNIIGKGGQNIKELIARCGGPTDGRASGQMVRFPRANEEDDLVTIRAPSAVASQIKTELEKIVATLKDRVVYGVAVPQTSHARLIGRGGAGVNELQRKHGVKIVLSNWQEFKSSGEVVNSADLGDAAETDIIKIIGPQAAAEAAAAEIKERVAAAPSGAQGGANRQRGAGPRSGGQDDSDAIIKTVSVPAHLHTRVTQGGKFFRTLPSGIRIDHGDVKPPSNAGGRTPGASSPAVNGAAKAARIDEDAGDSEDDGMHWEVTALAGEGGSDAEDIPWNIKGTDQAKVDRVEGLINAALERCKDETHRGVLTVPQTLVPRIVGRQGSGLDRLRALGVSVEVEGRQGANSVIFLGTPDNLEKAREAVAELSRSQRDSNR